MSSPLQKEVWVDGQFLKGAINGIARDTREIIGEILDGVDYQVIDWPRNYLHNSRINRKLLTVAQFLTNQRLVLPSRFQGTLFQPQLGPLLPGPGITTWIVRLHDIFPVTNPEWFRKIDALQFKKSLDFAIHKDALFLCDSKTSQENLLRYAKNYNINSRVLLCRTPVLSDQLCKVCDGCNAIATESLPDVYFLTVGTIEPRKNYEFALSFWNSRFKGVGCLIVVGKPGWKSKFVQFRLRKNRCGIFWFRSMCDGALKELYLKSNAYVSFSLDEGFNLPAMEARSLGVPLILTDIPIHHELHNGKAMLYKTADELEVSLKLVFND